MTSVPGMRRDTPATSQDGAFLVVNALTAYEGGVRRRLGLEAGASISQQVDAIRAHDADGTILVAGGGTINSLVP